MNKALLTSVGVFLAAVVVDLAAYFEANPFESWDAVARPEVLIPLLGSLGATVLAWLSRSPIDAGRSRRDQRSTD